MSSGPDNRPPSEPTFADVMNGFSFDAGRSPRRRRWGRKRDNEYDHLEPEPFAPVPPAAPPDPSAFSYGGSRSQNRLIGADADPANDNTSASAVRPYTWTRGRTKSGFDLAIETLVSTSRKGRDQIGILQVEHRAVAELCEQARSVAEVAALLSLPLGVAQVLLGDMAGLGIVTVHPDREQRRQRAGTSPRWKGC